MTTEQRQSTASQSSASGVGRATFGTVLFIAWGVLSVLWVYDAIYELAHSHPGPAIAGVAAILVMLVLAVMEGLEVVMIHDWSRLYPDRSAHDLAAWLSARQMFVASICVTATILAERHSIAIPFTSTKITNPLTLKIFNLVWTTFTILWFMQILPKVMAAINPDRYLKMTGRWTLPVVNVVKAIGISWPAEKTAAVVQRLTGWHAEPTLERAPRRGADLAGAWAALIPEDGQAAQRPPEQ
jgi:CBS domain containing-hemolysin-like protein